MRKSHIDFQAGDVVKLKSGGQRMTIEFINPVGVKDLAAHVVWMTPYAERMTAMIVLEALQKVE